MSVRQRVRRVVHGLRRRLQAPGVILLYHRVAALDADPWRLAVTPAHFAEHLEVLRRHRRPVTLADLREGRTRAATAVTFDDGYADNLDTALPLLERHDVPATFFLVTGELGGGREFWWDDLERIVLAPRRLPAELTLSIGDPRHPFALGGDAEYGPAERARDRGWRAWTGEAPTRRHLLYHTLYERLSSAEPEARGHAMDELHAWAGVGSGARPTHRRLDADDVSRLAARPLAAVGAHSVTHARLSQLSPRAQAAEIGDSRRRLAELSGRPILDFAYPFGKAGDYTPHTARLVREAGFRSGCANTQGVVADTADPFAWPRIQMDDCDGEEFSRRLSGAFG